MVRVDRYEREPLLPLTFSFIAGAALTVPAVNLELWAFRQSGFLQSSNFFNTVFLAFFAVAFNEELLKMLALLLIAFPREFFNEPLDGIVYAVLVSMGFATMENIAYADRFGPETLLLRSFTAVPAHLVFAIMMGYYVGLAKFLPQKRTALLWKGFLTAWLMHGAYDFLIFQNWYDWLFLLATISLYLCLLYGGKLIKTHLDNSPFRH